MKTCTTCNLFAPDSETNCVKCGKPYVRAAGEMETAAPARRPKRSTSGWFWLLMVIGVLVILLPFLPDQTNGARIEKREPENPKVVTSVRPASGPFSNIELLRRAANPVLEPVGWKDIGGEFYGSSTLEITNGAIVPSTVRYSINGRTAAMVDFAFFSTFVSAPHHMKPARSKMADAVLQWFKAMGKVPPRGLRNAIQSASSYSENADGIAITLTSERGVAPGVRQLDGSNYVINSIDLKLEPIETGK